MSRLDDLYKAMETLRNEGLPVNEDLEIKANELEEELIKNEILPLLTKNIEPALKAVKRELILVVDYVPNMPISVHLSRKRNFAADITDAKEIIPDPQVSHKTIKKALNKTAPSTATRLKITFADGHVIEESSATATLRDFVLEVGIDRVRNLGLTQSYVPLISNTLDAKYRKAQKPLGGGWYLMTNSPTTKKAKVINQIAEQLHIKLRVEII